MCTCSRKRPCRRTSICADAGWSRFTTARSISRCIAGRNRSSASRHWRSYEASIYRRPGWRAPLTRRTASRRAVVAHGRRARDVRCREIAPLDALRVAGHEVKPTDRCPFFPERGNAATPAGVAGVPARRRAVCRPDYLSRVMHPAPVRYAPGHPSTTPPRRIQPRCPDRRAAAGRTTCGRRSQSASRDGRKTSITSPRPFEPEPPSKGGDNAADGLHGRAELRSRRPGTKRLIQSGDGYLCDANRFLITSLDLPGSTQVIEASRERPFLGIGPSLIFASWRN